jgi:hypothetical protein
MDRSVEGDSDAESSDADRRKKRVFVVDVPDDDGNDLEPGERESDDSEDDDANIRMAASSVCLATSRKQACFFDG